MSNEAVRRAQKVVSVREQQVERARGLHVRAVNEVAQAVRGREEAARAWEARISKLASLERASIADWEEESAYQTTLWRRLETARAAVKRAEAEEATRLAALRDAASVLRRTEMWRERLAEVAAESAAREERKREDEGAARSLEQR